MKTPHQNIYMRIAHHERFQPHDVIWKLGIHDYTVIYSKPYYKLPHTTTSYFRVYTQLHKPDQKIAACLTLICAYHREKWTFEAPNFSFPAIVFQAYYNDESYDSNGIRWIHIENVEEHPEHNEA